MPVSRVPYSILFHSCNRAYNAIIIVIITAGKSQDALVKDLPARIVNAWASIASMPMLPMKDLTLLRRW